jgi:UDP-N-acetylmuramate--alanine ligase
MDEFATCFAEADSVAVLDIYAASEEPIEGVTGLALARAINESGGKPALYAGSFSEAAQVAASAAESGDVVLTLGAGNISQLAPQILKELKARETRAKVKASQAQSMMGLR